MRSLKNLMAFGVMLSVGCTSFSSPTSVSNILNHREQYHSKEIVVLGSLITTPDKIAICDLIDPRECLNLEVNKKILDDLVNDLITEAIVVGIYSEHEFKSVDGELFFYPSRIIVTDIKKN